MAKTDNLIRATDFAEEEVEINPGFVEDFYRDVSCVRCLNYQVSDYPRCCLGNHGELFFELCPFQQGGDVV